MMHWDEEYTKIARQAYGKIITGVEAKIGSGSLWIRFSDGSRLHFTHWQECHEDVVIEDIDIDLQDIVGDTLVNIEEAVKESGVGWWSFSWTFYKIQTDKTCATVRWLGESNGCYSEDVDWEYLENGEEPFRGSSGGQSTQV